MEYVGNEVRNERLIFMNKRMHGEYEEAKKEKFKIIPDKLYRYEKITNERLKTLENNEIYMSGSEYFNDPFDCRGVFWNIDEIHEYYNKNIESFSYTVEELNKFIDSMMENSLNPIKIACFSESKYNLPLWGNYADNRKGFCIEYNFKGLGINSEVIEQLYPVFYEEDRVDITFALKDVLNCLNTREYHTVLPVLFYKNLVKHISWAYEKEWRIVSISKIIF